MYYPYDQLFINSYNVGHVGIRAASFQKGGGIQIPTEVDLHQCIARAANRRSRKTDSVAITET